jgi:hypothetical protein
MVSSRKVPVDLAGFLRRHEIWRSLGTGDHAAAVKLYRLARADLDTWFDQQRRRRDRLQGRPHVGYDPLFNGTVPTASRSAS